MSTGPWTTGAPVHGGPAVDGSPEFGLRPLRGSGSPGKGRGGGGDGGEHLRVLLGARDAGNRRRDGDEEPAAIGLGGGALRCGRGGGESVVRCELLRGARGFL